MNTQSAGGTKSDFIHRSSHWDFLIYVANEYCLVLSDVCSKPPNKMMHQLTASETWRMNRSEILFMIQWGHGSENELVR